MRRIRRKKQRRVLVVFTLSLLLCLCVGYAAFSTNLNIMAKGNIKEKSRVIQSWTYTDTGDFHSSFYKENIVSVTFLDNNDVPSNATESFNVSEDKEHGGVIAYVIPNNEDNTKYDLYIGANGGVIANTNSSYLFYKFKEIKTINFNNNFDTNSVINMRSMFAGCYDLIDIDVISLDTKNVTDMAGMFYSCKSLKSLDLSDFNTSNVTSMSGMFSMYDFINMETSLTSLNLSGWDTSNVTSMRDMFAYNSNLTEIIGIESFNTSNVANMHGMFYSCKSLTELNLCSFDTSKVYIGTNDVHDGVSNMFSGTNNLIKIKVGTGWNIDDDALSFASSKAAGVTRGEC